MKKFESYVNDEKKGTINVFWSVLRNKYLAGVLSSVMTVTTLTGCSMGNSKVNINVPVNKFVVNEDLSELELNGQIEEKLYFVNQVLNELYERYKNDGNTIAIVLYNDLMELYSNYSKIEYNLDEKHVNEYAEVIMFSSIKEEKIKQLNILHNIIYEIEQRTSWRYGKDFYIPNHGCTFDMDEAIELKEKFVTNVLDELYESYQKTGNTISLVLFNELLDIYKPIEKLTEGIDPKNEEEYVETIMFDSIENVKSEILQGLDNLIITIEEKTGWIYGVDFEDIKLDKHQ